MAGALAERDFADKLHRAGFESVALSEHQPLGLDAVAGYPLFTPALIELMRRTIPVERHDRLATSVIATGRRPG